MGIADLAADQDHRPTSDMPFQPATPRVTMGEDVSSILRRRDPVLYHPYDSLPGDDFIHQAVEIDVLAIKRFTGQASTLPWWRHDEGPGKRQAGGCIGGLKARFDERTTSDGPRPGTGGRARVWADGTEGPRQAFVGRVMSAMAFAATST
jgi:polyphosphate kinase